MTSFIRVRPLLFLATLVLAAMVLVPAGGQAAKGGKGKGVKGNVYWLTLSGTAQKRPDYVFFTANAGGYMENVKWHRWGKNRTVGGGKFGTTAPCNGSPCPSGPAKLVLRKPVRCHPTFGSKKGKKIRVYKRARLHYPDSDGSRLTADISDRAGYPVCRESRR